MEAGREGRRLWLYLAFALGFTIALSAALDYFAEGIPLGFTIPVLNEPATLSSLLYHTAVLLVALYVGYAGLRKLIVEREFSIEFLMAVAALGAWYLDLLFEAATVLMLYAIAEYLEGYIEDRARRAVEALSAFIPDEARVIDGGEHKVDVKDVKPGSVILVKPGERVPLDGVVVEGFAHIDQSLVTGESTPVARKVGDPVFAGTLNLDGVLKLEVTKGAGETLVSRIVKLILESRKRKARIERLVDKFARFYVPVVISVAAFTAIFMPPLTGDPASVWLYRSLILLVVSCPSAFVVSVPATMFAAITAAARKGAIVKGGSYVEKMAKLGVVVFDKTGTLTLGRPVVRKVTVFDGAREDEALLYAAALEQYSNHPIASAIVGAAEERGLDYRSLKVGDVREISGKGIVGNANGVPVVVGSEELLKEHGADMPPSNPGSDEHDYHSRACVLIGGKVAAEVCVADDIRSDAVAAVRALKRRGLRTVMLTGDRLEVAREVAARLGMDEFYAELYPEDKLEIVSKLRGRYGLVAMVGDGVNDAPALAASDVGIAMGGAGVDVALETAEVVLVNDELVKVPHLIEMSELAVRVAKENIALSLAVKFALGALGFVGLIPLWFAVATGDDGVTLALLLNTLRLARVRAPS